jgi:hypothetical protein
MKKVRNTTCGSKETFLCLRDSFSIVGKEKHFSDQGIPLSRGEI